MNKLRQKILKMLCENSNNTTMRIIGRSVGFQFSNRLAAIQMVRKSVHVNGVHFWGMNIGFGMQSFRDYN